MVHSQDRLAVVGEKSDLLVPAGGGVGRRVAPRVIVESEEVRDDLSAVHVRSHLVSVLLDIGGRVSDGNGTKLAGRNVVLDVTSDSLDIRSSESGVIRVDNLVSGVEKEGVVVCGESVNSGEDRLEVDVVVRHGDGGVVQTIEGVVRGVDIDGEVDAGVSERLHAGIVVLGVVDRVDTDGVDAQLLELDDITRAAGGVSDGVFVGRGATRLVVDTADVETTLGGEESCGVRQ